MSDEIDVKARKELFLSYLNTGDALVKFTKVDGSVRCMRCTLKDIPTEFQPNSKVISKEDDNLLKVFDLEKNGWRSFKLDSVIEFMFKEQFIFQTRTDLI